MVSPRLNKRKYWFHRASWIKIEQDRIDLIFLNFRHFSSLVLFISLFTGTKCQQTTTLTGNGLNRQRTQPTLRAFVNVVKPVPKILVLFLIIRPDQEINKTLCALCLPRRSGRSYWGGFACPVKFFEEKEWSGFNWGGSKIKCQYFTIVPRITRIT